MYFLFVKSNEMFYYKNKNAYIHHRNHYMNQIFYNFQNASDPRELYYSLQHVGHPHDVNQ